MKNIVILAEKPSQAKAYLEAFDKVERKEGYYIVSNPKMKNAVITYGYGHLISLFNPEDYDKKLKSWNLKDLPILPSNFQFKVSEGKQKQYSIVKKLLDQADEIVIATDGDREGEAIARFIINHSKNDHKTLKRLWINSLEKEEIKKGLDNLKNAEYFYFVYKEAESRAFADWLVGINLSRLYTLHMRDKGMRGVFSIGRVQTPTLQMIYQRNQEIENFTSKDFFELYASFTHKNGEYEGKYDNRFNSLEELEAFIKSYQMEGQEGRIEEVTTEEKRNYPPTLFTLSDLQSLANEKYGYGANDTLNYVQSLYEKKIVSYPRTDCKYIGSPEFIYLKENLKSYLELLNEFIADPLLEENKRYVNGSKVQEHYAIIPTRTIPQLDKLTKEELNIYKLILYRTVSIFEKPYIYDETNITTTINTVPFKSKGKVEKELGWKRLLEDTKEPATEEPKPLISVIKGDLVESMLESKKGSTTPPKHFTEGTLITAMKNVGRQVENEENKNILKETEGIGTEATRANIIESLKNQGYIFIKNKKILVTDKAVALCSTLKGNEITNAELTAKWEKYLKRIREQSGDQKTFVESIIRFVQHLVDTAGETFDNKVIEEYVQKIEEEQTIGKCPNCKNNIIDKGKFYGCSGYKEANCTFTLPKKWSGKTLSKKNISDLLAKESTSIIKGFTSKSGKKFNAKLTLTDEFKITFIFENQK